MAVRPPGRCYRGSSWPSGIRASGRSEPLSSWLSRPRPGCPNWYRSATPAWPPRPSPTTVAPPCRWPPTSPLLGSSGIICRLCGDPHLADFGGFASPERELLFDVNDFDETLAGPFEWDLKRLAASFEVAAHGPGLRQPHGAFHHPRRDPGLQAGHPGLRGPVQPGRLVRPAGRQRGHPTVGEALPPSV